MSKFIDLLKEAMDRLAGAGEPITNEAVGRYAIANSSVEERAEMWVESLPSAVSQGLTQIRTHVRSAAANQARNTSNPSKWMGDLRHPAWQRKLTGERYRVADGTFKLLGDLTRMDLRYVAARYEKYASDNQAQADLMRALDKALGDNGAEMVQQLPPTDLEMILTPIQTGEAA